MSKNNYLYLLPLSAILAVVLFIASCVKPNNFADNYDLGVWVQYTDIPSPTFNSSDLTQSAFKATGLKFYGEPSKVSIVWVYNKKEYFVKELPLGSTELSITPLEMLQAYKSTYTLDSFSRLISPGDVLQLKYIPQNKAGDSLKTEQGSNLGSVGTYQNLNNSFTISVICSFVADDAVGTYTVDKDDRWGDAKKGDQLVVSKVSDACIRIDGYPAYAAPNNHSLVYVNQKTGAIDSIVGGGNYDGDPTQYPIRKGSGFVFSCAGKINATYNFGGSYVGRLVMHK